MSPETLEEKLRRLQADIGIDVSSPEYQVLEMHARSYREFMRSAYAGRMQKAGLPIALLCIFEDGCTGIFNQHISAVNESNPDETIEVTLKKAVIDRLGWITDSMKEETGIKAPEPTVRPTATETPYIC